jgi:hypothetical protein
MAADLYSWHEATDPVSANSVCNKLSEDRGRDPLFSELIIFFNFPLTSDDGNIMTA